MTSPGTTLIPTQAGLAGVDSRSLALTFDFHRAIVDDPAILDDVPYGAMVILLPPDDPELAAAEIESGLTALRQGFDVYFRHLRPGDRVPADPSAG